MVATPAPIRIAVSGTHSTGKSTLLKRLAMELRAHGHKVVCTPGSLANRAAAMGFPKMRDQTAATTQWLIAAGICAELEAALSADVVLVDRSVVDPLAYLLAGMDQRGQQPEDADRDLLMTMVTAHAAGYDLLLATALDPAVPLGNHRDRDLAFRASVDHYVHRLLATVKPNRLLVVNTDDSRNRARTAVLTAATQMAAAG
ncbi:AAA family ATPase [Streptomyces sp. SID13666]|uniref:AAA family ATPase n=1 Tax=unclassified Streptomyces TaxID=2593676 RepID=UPI0013C28DCC|nr:AAA family ATPase [Streptomyces sp. H39-C1]MCZ4098943.1 AAA family ATPase [Streptomyces sp. H39-C1]NEA60134.1 AAA family ATPase [Streptomyces sp. SID13666]